MEQKRDTRSLSRSDDLHTVTEKRYGEYHEDDRSVTLRNSGATYGGGSEVLVLSGYSRSDMRERLQGSRKSVCQRAEAHSRGKEMQGINGSIAGTLDSNYYKGCGERQNIEREVVYMEKEETAVRRLTPLECERLQGFPDGWTDIGEWTDSKGKKHKDADSPRYKALGNSIALPFWFWLLRRISAQYERPATLGSLFDGIGGFPLCWERCNGEGTAIWASEIEEFPIAVTKIRFPEKEVRNEL